MRVPCAVFCILLLLLLSACAPVPAAVTASVPADAPLSPTAKVSELPTTEPLARNTPTTRPSPTLTKTPRPITRTPSPTRTPRPSPTVTGEPSPTSWPTVSPFSFPPPPPVGAGEDHFYFGRFVPVGAVASASSGYRFGSTYGNKLVTHHGIDVGAGAGTPILAVAAGMILYAGPDSETMFGPETNFYGNLVVLQLAQAWQGHTVFALYGHLTDVTAQTGQVVNEGDELGHVGSTGVALGPHLHLEARLDAPESYWAGYNPELWLKPAPGTGTLAIRVVNEVGLYLPGVRVRFTCSDGAERFEDTYWDPGVNSDPGWGENGAQTDIPAGWCSAEADVAGQRLEGKVKVEAGRTAFLLLMAGG